MAATYADATGQHPDKAKPSSGLSPPKPTHPLARFLHLDVHWTSILAPTRNRSLIIGAKELIRQLADRNGKK